MYHKSVTLTSTVMMLGAWNQGTKEHGVMRWRSSSKSKMEARWSDNKKKRQ